MNDIFNQRYLEILYWWLHLQFYGWYYLLSAFQTCASTEHHINSWMWNFYFIFDSHSNIVCCPMEVRYWFIVDLYLKKTHFKMVLIVWVKVRIMVINATFNNISLILWRSVLLMIEGTGIPGENHRSAASHLQTLSLASNAPRLNGIRPLNFRLWLCARNVY